MGYFSYSMPESFMQDQSVPARWRILGIINGFHINGKDCYASNEWFMQRLKCSEQTVSNAVKELEDLGEITCSRTRRSRVIKRNLKVDPSQLGSQDESVRVSDPSSFGTISISNSDKLSIGADAQVVEVSDSEEKPTKTKKDTSYYEVYKLFADPWPMNWKRNTTQAEAAKNLLAERGLDGVQNALDWYKDLQSVPYCPVIETPYDLDSKWAKFEKFVEKNS